LLKDYQGAIADHTKAIELKPDHADAYFGRGTAKAGLGDKQGGLADVNKAIELGYPVSQEVFDAFFR
jgi:tetratricopeptide (TPR) repeat protein